MKTRTFIAIGSSALDALEQVDRAVDRLREHDKINVVAVSPWFATAPVGTVQARFINGVVEVSTRIAPSKLLNLVQKMECDQGRVPGDRWGPRAIDLDLLARGEAQLHNSRLDLPHPALWYRRFVLDPWARIAADWVVPRWNLSVGDLLRRLLQRPLPVRLIGGTNEERQEIADRITDEFKGSVTISSLPVGDVEPLRMALGYLPETTSGEDDRWSVDLSHLAADLQSSTAETARFILTAALDTPRPLSDT